MQKKYIIIPYDFKPLFALRRKLGPSMGPIKKPILCDIQDIHDLLMQKHGNELRIFEVELTNGELRLDYQNPVELNLSNYKLPYEEIYAMEHKQEETVPPVVPPQPPQPPSPPPVEPPAPPVTKPESPEPEPEAPKPPTGETDPEVPTTPPDAGTETPTPDGQETDKVPEESGKEESSPVPDDTVEEAKSQSKSMKRRR